VFTPVAEKPHEEGNNWATVSRHTFVSFATSTQIPHLWREYSRALGSEFGCDPAPDTPCATGDDGYSAFERFHLYGLETSPVPPSQRNCQKTRIAANGQN